MLWLDTTFFGVILFILCAGLLMTFVGAMLEGRGKRK